VSEWITDPANLPEERIRVLVFFHHKVYGNPVSMKPAIDTGYRLDGEWVLDGWIGPKVKAWMPLPEMPVIEEE
jgi:hypothetical protein